MRARVVGVAVVLLLPPLAIEVGLAVRRWRRWAVLIGPRGSIDDCVHDERMHTAATLDGDHAPLIARLVADGYQVASTDLERARGLVAAAARQTTSSDAVKLSSAYYLGRDLLDLGEAHLGGRVHAHPTSTSLGRNDVRVHRCAD